MAHYDQRKEQLAKVFSPREYQLAVGKWLDARHAILAGDKDVTNVMAHVLLEIAEVIEEAEKGDYLAGVMEKLDGGWLTLGAMWANGTIVNDWDIVGNVNGLGKRSDGLDRWLEIAGNITARSLVKDGYHMLGTWYSLLASQEVTHIQTGVKKVIEKNYRNYHGPLFSGIDPHTGQPWQDEEMMKLAFDIPRTHVRTLRDHLVKKEGLVDRKEGLRPSDLWPYHSLIMAFSQTDSPEKAHQIAKFTHIQLEESLNSRRQVKLEKSLINQGARALRTHKVAA